MVNLDRADNPTLFIPVVGTVEGAVQITPSVLTLGSVEGHSDQTKNFIITSTDGPTEVLDVRLPPGWRSSYQATQPQNDHQAVCVQVRFKPPNIASEVDALMSVIVERSGRKEELTIPVTGTITAAPEGDEQHAAQAFEPRVYTH